MSKLTVEIDIRQGIWENLGMAITTATKPKLNSAKRHHLPKSLNEAAGLLKEKYLDFKKHYRAVRKEWPYAKTNF